MAVEIGDEAAHPRAPNNVLPQHLSIEPELPRSDDIEEDDIPPLQWARLNGLALDHLADTQAFFELAKIQGSAQHGILDDPELPRFDFGSELKVMERVTISKEGATLLSTISQESLETIDTLVTPMLSCRSAIRRLALELPLLKTDHEADCKNFARRDGFEIKFQDIRLPLEAVKEENNDGLVWPSKLSMLGSQILNELKQEKLSLSKEGIAFLQGCIIRKQDWTENDDRMFWQSEQKYKRNTALEPITPPLSPLPAPFEPFEPSMSDPAFQLPILSDPASLAKDELEAIEESILKQDIPTPLRNFLARQLPEASSSDTYPGDGTISLGEVYSPLASLDNTRTPPSIESQRMKREELKVEEPLTPEDQIAPPKSVRFSDFVEEMVLDTSSVHSSAMESKFFDNAFGQAYKTANQQSEQERLIEADSTARVDVPIMDFSKPDPPWKDFDPQKGAVWLLSKQRSMMKEAIGAAKAWVGTKQIEKDLNWVPFPPRLAQVALEEAIKPDHTTWEAFVKDSEEHEVIDSSILAWKPPGLKILNDEDEDDEEIVPGKFISDVAHDLPALVKKRKRQLDQGNASVLGARTIVDRDGASSRNPVAKGTNYHTTQKQQDKSLLDGEFGMLGGPFSLANSLDNFLELQGAKKPKLTDSSYFQQKEPAPKAKSVQPQLQSTIQLPIRKSPISKLAPLPAPRIESPVTKTNVIVSSTLLKHRTLIKHLEVLLPGLSMVERDFTAHNTTTWMPGSVSRSPIKSSLDSEADIIVSPSMGIVITTLQKIKQKPLPGQKSKTAIRERLEKVSARYENLIVFVSENKPDESTNSLDDSDCLAFSSFVGFVLGLNSASTVQFVGGAEQTLSNWLASTIARHRVAGDSDLLEEETHWELFLRRTGMNAFAAQAIIAELKAPEGVDPKSPSKAGIFGLGAFVEMGVEEKIARFGPLCGRRMLERVSAVLNGKWSI